MRSARYETPPSPVVLSYRGKVDDGGPRSINHKHGLGRFHPSHPPPTPHTRLRLTGVHAIVPGRLRRGHVRQHALPPVAEAPRQRGRLPGVAQGNR